MCIKSGLTLDQMMPKARSSFSALVSNFEYLIFYCFCSPFYDFVCMIYSSYKVINLHAINSISI